MDIKALSDLVDTRLRAHEGGLSLDEYQKSVYLTKAQDMYYDTILENFEVTNVISEKIDRLISLVEFTDGDAFPAGTDIYGGIVFEHSAFLRKILRERVDIEQPAASGNIKTKAVREDRLSEIESSLANPFRKPGEHAALRVIQGTDTGSFNRVAIYIPEDSTLNSYKSTVAREPAPIVLIDLPDGLNVRNVTVQTPATGALFEFKDKDLEKIVDIAIGMIAQDYGLGRQQETQEQERT